MPLIPQHKFSNFERPSMDLIKKVRTECGKYIKIMKHCRQCRADAIGMLGDGPSRPFCK
jgi:nitrogen fixation protein NifB